MRIRAVTHERGFGIRCENKFELVLVIATIEDMSDNEFWAEIDEHAIVQSIAGEMLYFEPLYKKIEEAREKEYIVEKIKKVNKHDNDKYIVIPFRFSPKEIATQLVKSAEIIVEENEKYN